MAVRPDQTNITITKALNRKMAAYGKHDMKQRGLYATNRDTFLAELLRRYEVAHPEVLELLENGNE